MVADASGLPGVPEAGPATWQEFPHEYVTATFPPPVICAIPAACVAHGVIDLGPAAARNVVATPGAGQPLQPAGDLELDLAMVLDAARESHAQALGT